MLPYYLGCPSWNESAWRGDFYPSDVSPAQTLQQYAATFNAVEGNTTFYAWPSESSVASWAARIPAHFRFCAKLPRSISHADDLFTQRDEARRFVALLAPLGERVSPFWLQLPAGFGPSRLGELQAWLEDFPAPLAVEVRHPAFFERGEAERALNRLLHARGVERVCLDSRALFSCSAENPAVRHAQSKKPRLPPRPTAFSASPQLRFIGHPQLAANLPFLQPWLDKFAEWIEAGLRPYAFLHTPDNHQAPQLARLFHAQLQQRLPGLGELAWPEPEAQRQIELL